MSLSCKLLLTSSIFEKSDLEYGKHIIEVKVLNTKNSSSTGTKVELDAFEVLDKTVVKPSSVKVSTASGITTIGKGNSTVQMKAEILPEDAKDKSVVWTTSNSTLATVDKNGLVTVGNKNGTVIITAVSRVSAAVSGVISLKIAIAGGDVNEAIVEDGTYNDENPSGIKNTEITWSGTWNIWAGEKDKHHGGTKTETGNKESAVGSYFEYAFVGTGIDVYSQLHANFSSYDVYIDNDFVENVSLTGSSSGDPQKRIFSKRDLANGEHIIKCVAKEREGKYQVNLDYLEVFSPTEDVSVDKSSLQESIITASELVKETYSMDSWNAFELAYNAAVEVMNAEDATEERVTKVKNDLEKAKEKLVKIKMKVPEIKDEKGMAALVEGTLVVLSWDAVKDADSYKIVVSNGTEFTTTDTHYKVTGLTPGVTYNFAIYALNVESESSKTAIEVKGVTTTATPDKEAPAGVTGILKEWIGKNSVKLSWTAPADEDVAGYTIYINGSKVENTKKMKDASKTEYIMKDLEEGMTYVVKIAAFDVAGNSSIPEQFSFIFYNEGEDQTREIASIGHSGTITVEKGTAFEKLKLPKTVKVALKTRMDNEVKVVWEKGDYNADKVGTYTLVGELQLEANMKNPDKLKAGITITIKDSSGKPGTKPEPKPEPKPGDKNNVGSEKLQTAQNKAAKTGDNTWMLWKVMLVVTFMGSIVLIRRRKAK